MIQNVRDLRRRPGVLGVLFVAGAQFFVVGALDIIVVVAAEERLGLGTAGPGILLTLIGVGSIAGGVVSTALIRRERLAPMLVLAMLVIAVLAMVFGLSVTVVVAFVTLPLIGVSRSVIDLITDVLLHRSAPPDVLASVYAVIEIAAGIGLLLGSIGAQALLAISAASRRHCSGSVRSSSCSSWSRVRSIRLADRSATYPVVSMSLIRRLPVFATLPRAELETLCRSGDRGRHGTRRRRDHEGDTGDRYYAVMSGTFEVTVHGVTVYRAAARSGVRRGRAPRIRAAHRDRDLHRRWSAARHRSNPVPDRGHRARFAPARRPGAWHTPTAPERSGSRSRRWGRETPPRHRGRRCG